jgi:DNA repair photolyase
MSRPVSNPPNPWHSRHVEWLEEPPAARLEVFEEEAKTVLSSNDSPDVSFRWSVNPYRGCQHGCAYCYARASHQYLDLGAGTDFERKIVVKTNAPECLSLELARPSLRGETIVFSGNTDCYQPLEATYALTRRCLTVCRDRHNPVAVITKSALVRRDAALLAEIARRTHARVFVSIPFADADVARRIEPGASSPSRRFETLRILSEAGVPTGVSLAPLVPGLNESDVPEILERARAAGADVAFQTLVRLSAEVLPVFKQRIAEAFPERARKIASALREQRGGRWNDSRFGTRMHGEGPRWDAVRALFELHCRRLGFNAREGADATREDARATREGRFEARRAKDAGQGELFGAG